MVYAKKVRTRMISWRDPRLPALQSAGAGSKLNKMKALLGLLLSLSLGSCPLAMSLAAAASAQEHGCCPAPEQPAPGVDCCVSAAAPSSVAFVAPPLAAVALPHAAPVSVPPAQAGSPAADALAPPGEAPSSGPSCRAPPAVLA